MKKTQVAAIISGLIVWFGGTGSAASINVSFGSGAVTLGEVEAADSWNYLSRNEGASAGFINVGGSTLDVSYTGGDKSGIVSAFWSGWANYEYVGSDSATPENTFVLTLDEIPYQNYRIIVYFGGLGNSDGYITDGSDTYYYHFYNDGAYSTQAVDAIDNTPGWNDRASYAVFGSDSLPLSGSSCTITVGRPMPQGAYEHVGIGGFQVVEVVAPEVPPVISASFGTTTVTTGEVVDVDSWEQLSMDHWGSGEYTQEYSNVSRTILDVSVSGNEQRQLGATWADYANAMFMGTDSDTNTVLTMTLSQVPYEYYKLIVYLGGDAYNDGYISDGTDTFYYHHDNDVSSTGVQTLTQDTEDNSPDWNATASYAVFGSETAPLTNATVTLTVGQPVPQGYYERVGIGGFQVVELSAPPVEIGAVTMSVESNGLVLGWQGNAAATYAVQYRTNLLLGAWSNLSANIAGVGGEMYATNSPSPAQAFYRIIAE